MVGPLWKNFPRGGHTESLPRIKLYRPTCAMLRKRYVSLAVLCDFRVFQSARVSGDRKGSEPVLCQGHLHLKVSQTTTVHNVTKGRASVI